MKVKNGFISVKKNLHYIWRKMLHFCEEYYSSACYLKFSICTNQRTSRKYKVFTDIAHRLFI